MEYKEIENSPSSVAAHHGQKCGHTLMLTFSFLRSQLCTLQIVLPQLFSLLGSVMRLFENKSWFSLLLRLTIALPNLLQFDQVVNNSLPPPSHPFTTSQVAQPLLLVVYNTPHFLRLLSVGEPDYPFTHSSLDFGFNFLPHYIITFEGHKCVSADHDLISYP